MAGSSLKLRCTLFARRLIIFSLTAILVYTRRANVNKIFNLFLLRNYETVVMLVFIMENTIKKVSKIPRNFRLKPETDAELKRRSDITGIPETTILENALEYYFEKSMTEDLKERFKKIGKGFARNFKSPPLCFVNANDLFAA